jgi:hypothetical protein
MIEKDGTIQEENGKFGIEKLNQFCTVSLNARTGKLKRRENQNFFRNISSCPECSPP